MRPRIQLQPTRPPTRRAKRPPQRASIGRSVAVACLLALGLISGAAVYAWLDEDAGVETWLRLRREVAEARARLAGHEARNAALRAEIEGLRSDPFVQERAVREELRWVRPGEVLVRVPRDGASPPGALGGAEAPAPGGGALP